MPKRLEKNSVISDQQVVQEFVDSRGHKLRSDRDGGVLRGVKLLGLRSRNGRRYPEESLRQAIGLYEGAKVNVNHPQRDPLGPRDYRDRLGIVRNVHLKMGAGLFGDLHYNPRHALAEQLAWDAEHAPENVGLSHNVLARTTRVGEEIVVDEITRVQSVDLVADPATTAGLFEHAIDQNDNVVVSDDATLSEENDPHQGELVDTKRQLLIYQLLAKHGLFPDSDVVGEVFYEELRRESDEERIACLIEDRMRAVRSIQSDQRMTTRPECREQLLTIHAQQRDSVSDTASFVAAIRAAA